MFAKIFGKKEAKNSIQLEKVPAFRIGEEVQYNGHGKGVVRAINPNGTLLVRFQGQNKSQSIYPSFLDRKRA